MSDLIKRSEAIEAVNLMEVFLGEGKMEAVKRGIEALPSADTKDCTDFLLWLLEEIMDEENWELNAVADGEIIARKLKKLGLLEVKNGYYVRTGLAEAVQGEWGHMIADGVDGSHWYEYECSHCGEVVLLPYNFCPNCGARMYKGGEQNDD